MTKDLHMLKQKTKKADNYSLKSSPMIKGKAVNLNEAISEITKILKEQIKNLDIKYSNLSVQTKQLVGIKNH